MGLALILIKDPSALLPIALTGSCDKFAAWTDRGDSMRRLAAAIIALAAIVATGAGTAGSATGKKPAAKPPADPPMRVVLVRSAEQGCEPLCTEWIYAEGRITAATPAEFRRAFKKAGKLRLPIVVSSPGGDVSAAMAIGKLIREREAVVVVGKPLIYGCQPADKTCKPANPKSGRYVGSDLMQSGYCYSACGLVLAGGVQRFSPVNAIGTHQMLQTGVRERIWYREKYRVVKGKKKVISRKITKRERTSLKPTTKISSTTRKRLADYLAAMGVSQKYAELFDKATPSGIYLLNQTEMLETRIVTAEMPEKTILRKALCAGSVPAPHCVRLGEW